MVSQATTDTATVTTSNSDCAFRTHTSSEIFYCIAIRFLFSSYGFTRTFVSNWCIHTISIIPYHRSINNTNNTNSWQICPQCPLSARFSTKRGLPTKNR
jgi:hypothetical protein